jgi:hypothetical protein
MWPHCMTKAPLDALERLWALKIISEPKYVNPKHVVAEACGFLGPKSTILQQWGMRFSHRCQGNYFLIGLSQHGETIS